VAVLEIICKGRRQIGRYNGRPEPKSRDTALKELTRSFEELLWQRVNATLVLFRNRLYVSPNLYII